MNRDLFLSILAMDSYNRGYDQRLKLTGDLSRLGDASLGIESDVDPGTVGVNAGFYALAYDWEGETVISYRGTDGFAKDLVNGYGVGAGFTGLIAPQGDLALGR